MSRLDKAGLNDLQTSILHSALKSEVKNRRSTLAYSKHRLCVTARTKIVCRYSEQDDCALLLLEPLSRDMPRIFDYADHPDHRCWMNSPAVGLVVEADVAASYRSPEHRTSLGHPVDHLTELPHHLGPLGRRKVQTIGQR